MFDPRDLWREDTPTPAPTPRPARADPTPDDQARPGARGPDHPAREDRARERARERAGHRREHDARAREPEARNRTRRTRTERTRDAIADVGMYRAVSYTDLSEQHYDGHPYAARRAVTRMVRAGLIEEHEATGPQGNPFTVLTATEKGRDAAHRAALDAGHVPEQETWTGLVKPAELSHDTAVYRAALGDRAADDAKRAAATELGLPMHDDRVLYPDAQLEIEDADGVSGRVNVEIASDHYHAAAIAAKAGAGFAMHGSSRSATRKIARALARETDSGPGGGEPRAGRDGSVEL